MKNEYQLCGVCIIWCGGKIVLAERKATSFSGYYGVAGGKINKGENILDGTVREVWEETGAYIYKGGLDLIDCYVLDDKKQKVFIFESGQDIIYFHNIKHTEPKKLGPWKLYTKEEALKLNLMPYIREYLENVNVKKFKPIFA
jgi:8-oxo-dGTP pyrophosphatase MutT (NUDIX family)